LILGTDAAPDGADEDLVGRDRQRLEGEMDHQILEWALQRTKYDAYREAQSVAHIPAAFIAEMEDVLGSPQYEARGYFTQLDHPDAGSLRFPGLPAQMSGVEWEHRRAPRLGEHTTEILRELTDLTADEIAEVRAAGVI
jgi:crotonobetainyl-CoA:carnitine CoA-transferase CaiB-like acyl-CoA transferase